MTKSTQHKSLNIILILIAFASLNISLVGTENINLPKFVTMGMAGGAGFAYWLMFDTRTLLSSHKFFKFALVILVATMLNSTIWSAAPLNQNLYGILSRNTGVLTYLLLGLITLFMLTLKLRGEFLFFLKLLQTVGLVNLFYCIWVFLFRGKLGINDPFIGIDSLLGNPDFISAFLGISMVAAVAQVIDSQISKIYIGPTIVLVLADLAIMYELGATQGFVLATAGSIIVFFYKLNSKCKSKVIPLIYSFGALTLLSVGVLGALNRGPLSFLHENSVIFRGWYWGAAISMGSTHPWTGVGMDSYGDWFTRSRSLEAATSPLRLSEPNADSAHSVPLDFFASGGWPLLIAYLLVMAAVLLSIIKFTRRNQSYDSIFVALAAAWFCYQAQTLISLNQLGLAIWGWALGGALIAYEFSTRPQNLTQPQALTKPKPRKISNVNVYSAIGFGALIGFIVTFPPMNSDIKWKRAVDSGSPDLGRNAFTKSFFNPLTAQQYISGIKIFSASKLPTDALRLSREGVRQYSDNIEIWKLYLQVPGVTEQEREVILGNIMRLDPRAELSTIK